ncbi:MAG: hypothetical protein A2143_05640 [Gallionellales bacterium RBG_16_57_15]|nr:MAG: hypothetical protein A2143_05640 [Gallionellales bacterium RBG_16_57_15]
MNTMPQSNFIKRRIVYVDDKVQKWLLITLITLEILLVSGTLWVLYWQMDSVVEANLFRVHFSGKPNIYSLLLEIALIGLSGLVVINVPMLWITGWMWERHVNSILKPFRELMSKVEALDFSEDAAAHTPHKVVDLVLAWRHTERQRMLKLRTEIAKLNGLGELPDAEARHRASASLEAIRELLPD